MHYDKAALYAHTPARDSTSWHTLEAHLLGTAQRARDFAAPFGGDGHAYLVGLFHDVGKAQAGFQEYLTACYESRTATKCPHAAMSAALLYASTGRGEASVSLSLPVDGHHRGLMDWAEVRQDLEHLCAKERDTIQNLAECLPRSAEVESVLHGLKRTKVPGNPDLWTRMIFSALIDADRTDTAIHFGTHSEPLHDSLIDLARRLESAQEALQQGKDGRVNRARRVIYETAVKVAIGPPGFYRLTVPTGGGKTRTAMAFSLRHALRNGQRRVVVAIPYTSIIEQNAREYRNIFGENNVLEHHSQVEPPESEHDQTDDLALKSRLAAERWSHPIVVTTTVQLFESLFARTPSKARKLHRIAKSVIVLDEFQAFPPELLEPTLDVLQELVSHYGVTVVFCTATQPALHSLPDPLRVQSREIVPEPGKWFAELRRVFFDYRREPMDWDALAEELGGQSQVLVVLNTRKQARELLERLQAHDVQDLFHLSTLLCGAHRRHVLEDVRQGLKDGRPVRLVSTQVVEAGVDVDFPAAYRAVGPLDRIVQVAGRCNREGNMAHPGRVVLFVPKDQGTPGGPYRTGLGLAQKLLDEHGADVLEDLTHMETYFQELHQSTRLDKKGIQALRRDLRFEKVAKEYKLIDRATTPIVVDYERKGALLAHAWAKNPTLAGWHALQPYVVNLYAQEAATAKRENWISPITERLGLWTGKYDALFGIQKGFGDPSDLVI